MTTDTIDLTLAPPAVAWAVADLIERQGLAHGDFHDASAGLPPRECPTCLLGAVANACGFEPDAWEDDDHTHPAWRLVLDTCDWLIDAFALDHDEPYTEVLGSWSDARDADTVVRELRQAALEELS